MESYPHFSSEFQVHFCVPSTHHRMACELFLSSSLPTLSPFPRAPSAGSAPQGSARLQLASTRAPALDGREEIYEQLRQVSHCLLSSSNPN